MLLVITVYHSLSLNIFHSLSAVKDLTEFSPTFTNTVPSRVHVSATLFCRFRVRASQAIVERTFVKSSLTKSCVPLSLRAFRMTSTFVLWVVKRTMMSRGVSFSGFFRPIRCDRTTSWVDSCTSSLRADVVPTVTSVPGCSGAYRAYKYVSGCLGPIS